MRRYLALALASVLAAISVGALALGLGDIRLNSYLNQRLDAEIELVSAAADELESLEIRLADRAAFQRYGLEREAFLNNLQFRIVRRPNGTAYVKITSSEPVREPFLTFLVEADWSRGRLLREYTLLLDPPTFAGREEAAAEPQPQAPAATPAPQRVEREPQAAAEPAAPRVEEQEAGDVVSIPPLEADAGQAPPERAETTYPRQTEESYGPIQRNENLWSIANRVRPDSAISINQMMIALYRANPEAFQGNINRLKQGYILRIPSFDEVRAITRTDAFNEAKRHNDEWRTGTRPAAPATDQAPAPVEAEPELSLVAPEEEAASETGTGVGTGGEAEDLGMGAEESAPAGDDVDDNAVDLGVEGETDERLLELEDESLQALQEQPEAAEPSLEAPPLPEESLDAQETEPQATVEEAPVEEAPVEAQPEEPAAEDTAPASRNDVVAPVRRAEPTLLEQLMSPLGLGALAALLVLLLAGALVFRKRQEAARAKAAASMADWDESDDGDVTVVAGREHEDDDATVVSGGAEGAGMGAVFAHGMEHEDTGTTRLEDDAEATQLLNDADKTQLIDSEESKQDDFSETVVGGQAVTLDDNDPLSEADFHMAYGLYDQAAEVVQKAVDRDPTRKDYQAKLAEIHFAANNTDGFLDAARSLKELAGPGDPDWDNVAIMGRQIASDSDLFAEGGSTSSVDLDFGSADEEFTGEETVVKEESQPEPSPVDESLDFDIGLGGSEEAPTMEEPEPAAPAEQASDAGDLDFDLDIGGLGEGGEPETDTDATEQSAAADSAEDDFNFDLGDLGGEDADAAAPASEAAPAGLGDDDETQTEFDKALQELSAFVDTNLPEQDAGDAVSNDAELNLDEYNFDDSSSAGDDSDVGLDSGTGEDEEDIGEAGTKLDLARAYIDMGDPDGARGILEEVLSDGDDEQQQEARSLLEQIG